MNKIISFVCITAIVLTSCNNQTTNSSSSSTENQPETYQADIQALNDLLKKYQEPAQIFNVATNKPTQIKGKQGTVISINPANLLTQSGQPLGKTIDVELIELGNQQQLLKTNAQTVSDSKLLVSGGAYYINMTSDGQQLNIKEGTGLKVEFPKNSDKDMSLFYGQRDSLGTMNWQSTQQSFKAKQSEPAVAPQPQIKSRSEDNDFTSLIKFIKSDSTTDFVNPDTTKMTKKEKEKYRKEKQQREKENKLTQAVYNAMDIKSFGWINCDHFLNYENLTDVFVNLNPSDSVKAANFCLVFNDINSVMTSCYFKSKKQIHNEPFKNIPVGYKVKLIAYTLKNEKIYSYAANITVQNKQTINVSLKQTPESELAKMLSTK